MPGALDSHAFTDLVLTLIDCLSVPVYREFADSVTEIIRMIKSITAKKIFEKHPEVKKQLWDGEFWSDGFFVNTVSKLVCFREELIPRSSAAGSFIC